MDILKKVEDLYNRLPEVGCTGCGLCCVSPTSTLAEFIYLFNYLHENFTTEQIITFIQKPAKLHDEYEGNSHCPFLENHKCSIHPGRAGACRLFGIPSLKEMGIQDMEECRNNITVISGRGDLPYIESWLNELFEFENTLYPLGAEPYFVKGFNVNTWLDIYFDDSIDFDVFKVIKDRMSKSLSLDQFKAYYKPTTNIREKIDKIGIFNSMIGNAGAEALRPLLISIRDDYPLTGTYFFEEAQMYLKAIDENS